MTDFCLTAPEAAEWVSGEVAPFGEISANTPPRDPVAEPAREGLGVSS